MSKKVKKPTPGAHAGIARFHTYNAGVAIDLNDVTAAIVLHHVWMNIERLIENNKLDADGMAWLTVSKTGIIRFLPEFSKSQIETAINKLVENGLLVKKVSNRKNSYTLSSDIGWSYYPMLPEEGPVKAPKAEVKADAEEANKTAEKENNATKPIDKVSDIAKEVIEYVNKKAGKHFDYAPSYCRNIDCLVKAGFTKEDMFVVVDYKYEELSGTRDFNTGMNPSKLFYIKTFEKFLEDVKKDSEETTMSPEQLIQDSKEKQDYHLREAKKCQVERLVLETGACDDNLPFGFISTMTPEELAKDRRKKELYHMREASKFENMAKLIKAQSVK